MVNDTKSNPRASFKGEGSLLARTFAMQSSPASASGGQSLKRGLGNPKSSHLPQSNPGSAWDWAFPARGREPENLWLAQALNQKTRASLVARCLRHPYLIPQKCKSHSALFILVCKTGDLKNACRDLKGFWLVTCRQVPGTLPAHSDLSLSPGGPLVRLSLAGSSTLAKWLDLTHQHSPRSPANAKASMPT